MANGRVKRPSRALESDDESQGSSNKRVKKEHLASDNEDRVRVKQENGLHQRELHSERDDAESDNDSDVNMYDDEESDVERDESDSEDDIDWDDTAENVAALERVRRETNNTDMIIPQAGVIKSVRLINFMNHKNFSFDNFGQKINFIVGHNGSGKSAILTAIAIALGARASVTGRGTGVKDLIRRGAEKATIIVVLRNRGVTAYNPEKYPNQIVIERTFDKKGSTQFKFRAERDGPILESKRSELDNILSHFAINMDSPMTLLTQDMAKSFLASADEKKLYDFFLNGSGLKPLSDSYTEMNERVTTMEKDIRESQSALPARLAKKDKLQRVIQAADKQRQMQNDYATVRSKLGWLLVAEREEQLAAGERRVEENQEKMEKLNEAIAECDVKLAKIDDNIKRLTAEYEELNRERIPFHRDLLQVKRDRDAKQRALAGQKGVLEDLCSEIDNQKREIEMLERKMAARENQNGTQENSRESQIRAELKKIHIMRSNMNRSLHTSQRDVPLLEKKAEEARAAQRELETRRDEAARRLDHARRQQDNLSAQSTDPLAAFGHRMDIVVNAIDRARWRERPLGPLGRYVKLKDHRYKEVAHSALGSILCGFAVRYPEDKAQLMSILRDALNRGYIPGHGRKQVPTIYLHKGDLFDFSAGDLSDRAQTLLSILDVSHSQVLRLLIDIARIEVLCVAPNQEDALDLINRLISSGLSSAVVYSADVWRQTGRAQNNYRDSGPLERWRGNTLFTRDTAGELEALKQQINTLTAELQSTVDECKQGAAKVRDAEKAVHEAARMLRRAETGFREGTRKINDLEDELARIQPDNGDALQLSKDDAENELQNLEQERAKIEDEVKAAETQLREAEMKIQELEARTAGLLPACAEKKDAIHQQAEEQVRCTADKEFRLKSKQTTQNRIDTEKRGVEESREELVEWIARAEEVCARPQYLEPREELERRHRALQLSINEAKERNPVDLDEASRKFNEACKQLKEAEHAIRTGRVLVRQLRKGLEIRLNNWVHLRHNAGTRLSAVFTLNLNSRGFEGTITFDHAYSCLRLRVSTASAANGGVTYAKSAHSLSGGERSYSTVCFLLAMWDLCPTSIACLDEWDVFLDSVNRQLAGSLLMQGARNMQEKQFIFITPLDMGGLQVGGEHCKIIRLGDPERDQGTLQM